MDRNVDTFDGRLIRALQEDGRASIHDLARSLTVSRDFVSQRLRALTEHDGLRIVAAVDPSFAGHHVLVHGMVSVEGPVRPVGMQLVGIPDAVFVSMVSGPSPLVFESRHGDVDELHAMLDQVRRIPSVRQVRITTYAEVLKGFFVADSRGQVVLDGLDHALIGALQHDGRAGYSALADLVHLSPSSVRSRVRRLIDAGVIRISAIKAGGLSRNRLAVGLGITVRGEAEPVRQYILDAPAIDFAARSHGNYDFIATVIGTSSADVLAVIEEIRALPEAGALDTWTHLDIVKEDYARTAGPIIGP